MLIGQISPLIYAYIAIVAPRMLLFVAVAFTWTSPYDMFTMGQYVVGYNWANNAANCLLSVLAAETLLLGPRGGLCGARMGFVVRCSYVFRSMCYTAWFHNRDAETPEWVVETMTIEHQVG